MNTHDRILATLNLGGPFNDKAHVWRRLDTVVTFAEQSTDEVLSVINGDLANDVVLRPSAQGKGIMVALKANIPPEPIAEPAAPVVIMGGNAVQQENPCALGEVELGMPMNMLEEEDGYAVHGLDDAPDKVPVGVAMNYVVQAQQHLHIGQPHHEEIFLDVIEGPGVAMNADFDPQPAAEEEG
jgi:hypothetical protein